MTKQSQILQWGILIASLTIFGCEINTDNVVTSSDGVEIRFDLLGNGSPTLVFVHGWSNNRGIWDAQVNRFSGKYRVVNLDLPGFGESGNNRERFTIESFAEDVVTVMTELHLEPVVLVGFSMGAPVVIEAANKNPDLISGVILVDAFHDAELITPLSEISNFADSMMDFVANPTNEELVNGGFYINNTDKSFNRVIAMLQDVPRIGWKESLIDSMRWRNEDSIRILSQLQVPIIAINAELPSTNIDSFKKYVPSYRVKIVKNAGHLVMWDAPDEFNRLLEESIQEFDGHSR